MDSGTRMRIDHFFLSPDVAPSRTAQYSVLYLLRRDVRHCFEQSILGFPSMMAIFAGVELLGKLHAGSDPHGEAGERFKRFASRFMGATEQVADSLWYLRCALMHSFGLAGVDTLGVDFSVDPDASVVRYSESHAVVAAWPLWRAFERSISDYQDTLEGDDALQRNFDAMHPRYGSILIVLGGEPPA